MTLHGSRKRAVLEERLARLETLAPAELRREWAQVFKSKLPPSFTPELMRRAIAYTLQERAYGGLKAVDVRRIVTCAAADGVSNNGSAQPLLRPGTRLARQWQGATHHVLVTDGGFEYREKHYRSLTGIARTITGAGWSGPRFFGLTGTRKSDAGGT